MGVIRTDLWPRVRVVAVWPAAERLLADSRLPVSSPGLDRRIARDCDALLAPDVLSDAQLEVALASGVHALADLASLLTTDSEHEPWLFDAGESSTTPGWWRILDPASWQNPLGPPYELGPGRWLNTAFVHAWVERGAVRECSLEAHPEREAARELERWVRSGAARWAAGGVVADYDDSRRPSVFFWEDRLALDAEGPLVRLRETGEPCLHRFIWRGQDRPRAERCDGAALPHGDQWSQIAPVELELGGGSEVPADLAWASDGRHMTVSRRFIDLLCEHRATGWRACPLVRVAGDSDSELDEWDYATEAAWAANPDDEMLPFVLSIDGTVGAPDWSQATQTTLYGGPTSEVTGWPIDLATWGGADLCQCTETGEVFVSRRVAEAIVKEGFVLAGSQESDEARSIILTPMERVRTRRTAPQLVAAGMPVPDYLWLREPVDSRPAHLREFGVI